MESPYIPIKFKNPNPSPGEVATLAPFISFLEDFRAGSFTTLHKHVLPLGRALNLRPVPSGFIQASLSELITRVSQLEPGQKVAEPLYNVEVWVDRNIAVAWTPYDFFSTSGDGETRMTHRGTDIVFLAKVDDVWKWSGLADNCRVNKGDGKIPKRYEGPESQDPEEEKVVLGVFQDVIDLMCAHEYERIEELVLPGTQFTFHRGEEVDFPTMGEFVAICHEMLDGKNVEEHLLDVKIRIDDDVALIWSPYRFVVGDNVSFGSDMVTLAKLEGKWLITGIGNNNGDIV